jgi:type II secretory ATPase GspE/PulE/Tfp pilus assembly ATPase PilB-like protein
MEAIRQAPHSVTDDAIEPLLADHPAGSLDFLEAIIEKNILSKDVACKIWGDTIGIAYVEPVTTIINRDAMELIPQEIALKARILPLYLFDTLLTVAMPDPTDRELLQRLSQISQHPVSGVFSLPSEIAAGIAIHYQSEKSVRESLAELRSIDLRLNEEMTAERVSELTENASLIQVVNSLLYFALRERASDIHIEPRETLTKVRFRVDGILREMITFPRKIQVAIVSRLKILCNLNITESRFPQDGRFTLSLGSNRADFRLSFMPTMYGEKVVIRILAFGGKKDFLKLDQMLISQTILQPFKRVIQNPNGIVFVTGPTGSGKTTTLYAALAEINTTGVNIVTIEDPVELQLEGINQTQVNAHIDLSFGLLLRSILRQDPDVILIGEIRDLETAKIATEAALTGHLVLATLHTNNALQAITRLIDIGVEPYQVAPSVIAVVAQRLAARICQRCKEPYYPSRAVLAKYFQPDGLSEVPFYRGRGCSECGYTGYHGRVSFHELVLVTEEMRSIINRNGSMEELGRAAKKVGYRPLRYDGLKKVLLGLTTIEEIEQNTSFEWAY